LNIEVVSQHVNEQVERFNFAYCLATQVAPEILRSRERKPEINKITWANGNAYCYLIINIVFLWKKASIQYNQMRKYKRMIIGKILSNQWRSCRDRSEWVHRNLMRLEPWE